LTKTPLIYSVSFFNLVGLELCFGWLNLPKTPWRRDCCSLFFPTAIATEWKMGSANFCCRNSSSKLQQQLIIGLTDKL